MQERRFNRLSRRQLQRQRDESERQQERPVRNVLAGGKPLAYTRAWMREPQRSQAIEPLGFRMNSPWISLNAGSTIAMRSSPISPIRNGRGVGPGGVLAVGNPPIG